MDNKGESFKKLYVLPDYQTILKGYVKNDNENLAANEQVWIVTRLLLFIRFWR